MRRRIVLIAAMALAAALLPGAPASAAVISPNVFTDDLSNNGNCTLREAIVAASDDVQTDQCPAGNGPDTIPLKAGTYSLTEETEGDLAITQDLTITGAGPGVTIIDGAWAANSDRILHIIDKPDVVVNISGLTIQGGELSAGSSGGLLSDPSTIVTLDRVIVTGNTASSGGGITNGGTMTLTNSSVTGNTTTGCCAGIVNDGTMTISDSSITGNISASSDGGVYNTGTATLSRVTISGNSAAAANGGFSGDGGMATLTNVTISGNSAGSDGGGVWMGATAELNNVTITGNRADSDGEGTGDGGGIHQDGSGTITLRNTIVAGNTDGTGEAPDCDGNVTSGGHNLMGNTTGCTFTSSTGDLQGVDPMLGPLADNGGLTLTHALPLGSPAVNAAGPDAAPTDQRGLPRSSDIGAYELVLCRKVPINRIGTAGNDVLAGTSGADGFLAQDGNDRAKGLGGSDAACMGGGKDTASGGGGKDTLLGEAGKDKLKGQGGKDVLKGGPGKDTCTGGGGRDKATCEKEKKIP